jgi:hypothetical protein
MDDPSKRLYDPPVMEADVTTVAHAVKQWHRGLLRGFEVIGEFVGELLFAAARVVLAAFFVCLVGAALFGAAYLVHAGWLAAR